MDKASDFGSLVFVPSIAIDCSCHTCFVLFMHSQKVAAWPNG